MIQYRVCSGCGDGMGWDCPLTLRTEQYGIDHENLFCSHDCIEDWVTNQIGDEVRISK